MSINILRREIEFSSLLSYSVSGRYDSEAVYSRKYKDALKKDEAHPIPPTPMSVYYAGIIKMLLTKLPFAPLFQATPVLIPLPTHSVSDWRKRTVPERIALALSREGLGRDVFEQVRLRRTIEIPAAHRSAPQGRPTPQRHYETTAVEWMGHNRRTMDEPKDILLIDDFVTQGSIFLGALNRVAQDFPRSRIRAFAMMRAMSDPLDFHHIYEPVIGKITLEPGRAWPFRRP